MAAHLQTNTYLQTSEMSDSVLEIESTSLSVISSGAILFFITLFSLQKKRKQQVPMQNSLFSRFTLLLLPC